mmetsp:Transcript_71705/g.154792  ORF Transcript_71705/g.154792 Transcript_71705/m.154792 type:complete len:200 (+) Transcript_71705:1529-2128(+)
MLLATESSIGSWSTESSRSEDPGKVLSDTVRGGKQWSGESGVVGTREAEEVLRFFRILRGGSVLGGEGRCMGLWKRLSPAPLVGGALDTEQRPITLKDLLAGARPSASSNGSLVGSSTTRRLGTSGVPAVGLRPVRKDLASRRKGFALHIVAPVRSSTADWHRRSGARSAAPAVMGTAGMPLRAAAGGMARRPPPPFTL